eukprot:scaffold37067_cov104-Phaeocystis_antarctica.AAC.2
MRLDVAVVVPACQRPGLRQIVVDGVGRASRDLRGATVCRDIMQEDEKLEAPPAPVMVPQRRRVVVLIDTITDMSSPTVWLRSNASTEGRCSADLCGSPLFPGALRRAVSAWAASTVMSNPQLSTFRNPSRAKSCFCCCKADLGPRAMWSRPDLTHRPRATWSHCQRTSLTLWSCFAPVMAAVGKTRSSRPRFTGEYVRRSCGRVAPAARCKAVKSKPSAVDFIPSERSLWKSARLSLAPNLRMRCCCAAACFWKIWCIAGRLPRAYARSALADHGHGISLQSVMCTIEQSRTVFCARVSADKWTLIV